MKNEAEALNEFEEFKNKARFNIKRLFTDEGSEFMGVFAHYCEENGIRITVFKANTGTKRRSAIVERFNRTLRRLMEEEMKINGKNSIKGLIAGALDMYNRYLNNRPIKDFFRKTKSASLIKRKIGGSRFFSSNDDFTWYRRRVHRLHATKRTKHQTKEYKIHRGAETRYVGALF